LFSDFDISFAGFLVFGDMTTLFVQSRKKISQNRKKYIDKNGSYIYIDVYI